MPAHAGASQALGGGADIDRYNTQRLDSAIGYVTPRDVIEGRQAAIRDERAKKLQAAGEQRRKTTWLNQEPAAA